MFALPERTNVVLLKLEHDSSRAVTHPAAPAPCRGVGWLLPMWVGMGSIAGGNSSGQDPGVLQLLPDSHDCWPVPCTQGWVSGVKVLVA